MSETLSDSIDVLKSLHQAFERARNAATETNDFWRGLQLAWDKAGGILYELIRTKAVDHPSLPDKLRAEPSQRSVEQADTEGDGGVTQVYVQGRYWLAFIGWGTLLSDVPITCLDGSTCDIFVEYDPEAEYCEESYTPPYGVVAWQQICDASLQAIDYLLKRVEGRAVSEPTMPSGDSPLPSGKAIVLNKRVEPVVVNGTDKGKLNWQQYNVLRALIGAGDKDLSMEELKTRSESGDAVNVLSRLKKRDDDWDSVIFMAGQKGGRYRVKT